ncbi:DUF3306 domain-containing protein [Benzoatithermus flavus]|uniref:DUF3306 domain-containing protein n=1 Tax=Benzoatithermus flavus TaxID=3108223 RepID=A0ABU8XRG5_9PROT
MAEEGFLARWSRLKHEARLETEAPPESAAVPEEELPPDDLPVAEPETLDLEGLPPVETLTAESDYTAFLRKGVPEELQRLALRKAWTTDPVISGFRGFAEYDWDCNAPGYGALLPADDVVKLCRSVLNALEEKQEPTEEEPPPPPEKPPPLLEHEQVLELVATAAPPAVIEIAETKAQEAG